jgi:hypothetical protein
MDPENVSGGINRKIPAKPIPSGSFSLKGYRDLNARSRIKSGMRIPEKYTLPKYTPGAISRISSWTQRAMKDVSE